MTTGEEYSPTVDWASPDLFGLSGAPSSGSPTAPSRRWRCCPAVAPRSPDDRAPSGVSLAGDRTAVVSGDGTRVWRITSREGAEVRPTAGRPRHRRAAADVGPHRTAVGGRPGGAPPGRSRWSRTATGSGSADPELRGVRLEAAAVSRDGSRFVVLARLPDGEVEARLFRVVRDDLGAPLRLAFARDAAGAEHAAAPARGRLVGPHHGRGHDPALGVLHAGAAAADRRGHRRGHRGAAPGPALRVRSDDGRLARARRRACWSATRSGNVFDLGADGRWADRGAARRCCAARRTSAERGHAAAGRAAAAPQPDRAHPAAGRPPRGGWARA